MCCVSQDIPAATESAGQAAAAVDGVFHVLTAGEEAANEEKEQPKGAVLTPHYAHCSALPAVDC